MSQNVIKLQFCAGTNAKNRKSIETQNLKVTLLLQPNQYNQALN